MVVCPNCRGHGIEPGTGITFTRADVDEWFGDDHEERESGARAWAEYGQPCSLCRGRNVVTEQQADDYTGRDDQ